MFNYKVIAFWLRFSLAIIAANQLSLIILEILFLDSPLAQVSLTARY